MLGLKLNHVSKRGYWTQWSLQLSGYLHLMTCEIWWYQRCQRKLGFVPGTNSYDIHCDIMKWSSINWIAEIIHSNHLFKYVMIWWFHSITHCQHIIGYYIGLISALYCHCAIWEIIHDDVVTAFANNHADHYCNIAGLYRWLGARRR